MQFYLVPPTDVDIVVTKNSYSAFVGTDLDKKLKEKGIKYLIITGIFSDGCVLATIVDGFAKGYNFIILQDLIETTDSKTRQTLQEHLKKFTFPLMYGQTISSTEFLKITKK